MNKKHRRDDFNKKNNIQPVEKGTKEFMSRRQLERKAREMKATKRSIKTVSEVRLDTNEEDILVSLIARLKNIKLVEKTEELPVDPKSRLASINENEGSDNSDTESGEDDDSHENSTSDSDEEDKEDTSEQEQEVEPLPKTVSETTKADETEDRENNQSKSVMLKPAFIRKLIRDDRYQRKLLSTGQVQSAEKVAAKIRRTLENSKSSSSSDSILQKHNAVPSSSSAGKISSTTISSSSAVKPAPPVSTTVRMLVDCPKGSKASKGQPKVMVFNRSLSTNEIIAQIRPKFNATAKFNALKIVSENKNLDDFELMTLADGELIHLIQDKPTPESYQRKEKYSSGVFPPNPPLLDEEPTNNAVGALKTAEEQVENDNENQPDGKMKEENDDNNAQSESTQEVQDDTVLLNLLHEENEFYSEHYDNKSLLPNPSLSQEICQSFLQFQSSQNKEIQQKISTQRRSLPIYQHKNEILSLIANNQVILISGETGSGKTTQLPSYILEEIIVNQRKGAECNIAVTQPRRIAAVSIAERVSYELYGSNNTVGKDLIGYQVRLDAKYGEKTRLLYCTTGVLLRKLQNPDYLRNLSHIVIDEIHERTVETDFLLTIIKQQLTNYPNLRIVSGKMFLLFYFFFIMVYLLN
jgi:hypothetical protein